MRSVAYASYICRRYNAVYDAYLYVNNFLCCGNIHSVGLQRLNDELTSVPILTQTKKIVIWWTDEMQMRTDSDRATNRFLARDAFVESVDYPGGLLAAPGIGKRVYPSPNVA